MLLIMIFQVVLRELEGLCGARRKIHHQPRCNFIVRKNIQIQLILDILMIIRVIGGWIVLERGREQVITACRFDH